MRKVRRGRGGVAALAAAGAGLALAACTLQPNPRRQGGGGAAAEAPSAEAAITAMLEASAGSWNAGDLEGFLNDYSTRPELTFVGSSGIQRGIDEVRARYETSYWSPGAERDSLRFEDVEVRPLGGEYALTLGRYVLFRPGAEDAAAGSGAVSAADSVTATGRFTLVLRREDGAWKIIHDHSSASE